jgi:hypothetical protein
MTVTVVTEKDLTHLAERCLARARSRMPDQTSLQNDLLLVGKLLTRWTRGDFDLGLPLELNDD